MKRLRSKLIFLVFVIQPFFQLDIILVPTPALPLAHMTLSHSSLLLGYSVRLISQSLTLHHTHLILRHYPFATLPPIDLILSHSAAHICQWLGLSYVKWSNGTFRTVADYFAWLADVDEHSLLGGAWRKMIWETKRSLERGRGYGEIGDKRGKLIRAQLIGFRRWLFEESRFKDLKEYEPGSRMGGGDMEGGRGKNLGLDPVLVLSNPDNDGEDGCDTQSTPSITEASDPLSIPSTPVSTNTRLSPTASEFLATAPPSPTPASRRVLPITPIIPPLKAEIEQSPATSSSIALPCTIQKPSIPKSAAKKPKLPQINQENPKCLSDRALTAIKHWGGIQLVEEYERLLEQRRLLARDTVATWRRKEAAALAASEER